MRHNANDGHGQAVVIGSGMAGLSAAKMLSKHFSRVVVLEKDEPRASWQASAAEVVKVKLLDNTCSVKQSCSVHADTSENKGVQQWLLSIPMQQWQLQLTESDNWSSVCSASRATCSVTNQYILDA